MIPASFINLSADVLGETHNGLSGPKIAEYCLSYSCDYNVGIPYSEYPFPVSLSNKRTALKKNLEAFSPEQQYRIIKDLCNLPQFIDNKSVKDLKIKLIHGYSFLGASSGKKTNEPLIEETGYWLEDYPEAFKLYNDALNKFRNDVYQRNLLDDLRLSLELLLKSIFENEKSLENQISSIGKYISDRNGSRELSNMFSKLLNYFSKYQNEHIKHNNFVIESEIEFVFEITCSFMKFLIKIK